MHIQTENDSARVSHSSKDVNSKKGGGVGGGGGTSQSKQEPKPLRKRQAYYHLARLKKLESLETETH